jgi:outer membrane protein OmpA-like peptidoglycan-associated protein
MKIPHRHIVLIAQAMLFSMACVAFGQEDTASPSLFLGAFGRVGPGIEFGSLTVPGFEECGAFNSGGRSFGWQAGGLVELPLGDRVALQLRPGVSRFTGSFREPLASEPPIALQDGSVVPVMVDQVLDFTNTSLRLDALASFGLPLSLRAQVGILLEKSLSSRQTHREELVAPDAALFAGINRREYIFPYGSPFASSPLLAGLSAGLAYDLPIGPVSTLSPELAASLPINSEVRGGGWRSLALTAGLSLRFGLRRSPPPPPVIDTPAAPPPPAPVPILAASVTTEPTVVSVRIDEYDSVEVLPLLNHIYFAEGSADLRPQYRRLSAAEADAFTKADLTGSALDVYYHILNIVGLRMRGAPEATLTINGYRNGRENDQSLPLKRAQAVRRYLADVWGIAPRRLKVVTGEMPPNPSSEYTSQGYEENARVELIPSDPNIIGPHRRRHILRTATPPAIRFHFHTVAEAGVARWRLEVDDEGRGEWKVFDHEGANPNSLVWNWRSDKGDLPSLPMRLRYRLTITDSTGHDTTTPQREIDVAYQTAHERLEHRENDTLIESFSILLFNFDSPKVSASDNDLLRAIASGVKSHATVRFIGYTDSLGEAGHNRELATMRASEAAHIFQRLVPKDVTIIVDDRGGEHERFPYSTPEGRAHCRTVDIEVRTPKPGGL